MKLINRLMSGFRRGQTSSARRAPARFALRRPAASTGGKYDAAQTTDDNRRHWANADGLSADAAMRPEVRQTLVRRSRYEYANNGYALGLVNTIANDCIGIGPKLQMLGDDETTNDAVEGSFAAWAAEIDLAGKLRMHRAARCVSGESLLVLVNNPALRHPVKLDLRVIECDRLAAPYYVAGKPESDRYCDGIEYDEHGNPKTYYILKYHPGNLVGLGANPTDYDEVPAKYVRHFFKRERPEQRRGIPELTPALPLFAQLRRYTMAVLGAAETAADYAAVIQTDTPASEDDNPDPFETFDIEQRMGVALPMGWKLSQLKAEQPVTAYRDFIDTILREIARCLNVPFTIAAMDSSRSNMASAYMDAQGYAKSIAVDRHEISSDLNWILGAFLAEAEKVPQLDGITAALLTGQSHSWLWSAVGEHADPSKVAKAQETRMRIGITDLSREHSMTGREAKASIANQARVLGISAKELQSILIKSIYQLPPATAAPTGEPSETEPEDEEQQPKED